MKHDASIKAAIFDSPIEVVPAARRHAEDIDLVTANFREIGARLKGLDCWNRGSVSSGDRKMRVSANESSEKEPGLY